MTKAYGFYGSSGVGRASRAWWLRRIRSAVGLTGFAAALVFTFLVAMLGSGQPEGARGFASDEPYYRRCADARAAGVAPIYRGEPGYRPPLDADNDGVACEPYGGR
jgi:hypothetical protein